MSHDTDKLIRQLSLVAFLMAERRPLTARDVKGHVEGYSEMSDEAFARRYYSDRAELLALGVPLHSTRDELTGEELYTLRPERYFLPPLELSDEELAALWTAVHLLEGRFAYAEPLRLALQNLVLGRGVDVRRIDTNERVKVHDPEYSPELQGRLGKLETAIAKGRTIRFAYWSIGRDEERERTVNPYALYQDGGAWYVVGQDVEAGAERTFRVSRIRSDIRFATRRERDFRLPAEFDVARYRGRPSWQIGEAAGEARVGVAGDTAWWVHRTFGDRGRVEGGVFTTAYSSPGLLASWILRQDGRATPLGPEELRSEVAEGLRRVREAHEGPAPALAPEVAPRARDAAPEREGGPVAPERFAVLQALLAHLLAACGEGKSAVIAADELAERLGIGRDALEEHLWLLNLVSFGGGCYAVYAQLQGDDVHVDKELYGDAFRAPPRLTPLEARAIRLALELVGPLVAASANSPLDNVRRKLEETFGEFELAQTPAPQVDREEEDLVATLARAVRERRLVEVEYLKEGEETPSTRVVEPYEIERRLPNWYVHTWDRTSNGERSFRLDRMKRATLTGERFDPREGFDPGELRDATTARVRYSERVARWELERGARPLADGAAVADVVVGSVDWLVGTILAARGEAVVVEPAELRAAVAARAAELERELGLAEAAAPA